MQPVKIFTTQYCPFCIRAKALLKERGAEFEEIKIDEVPAERATMLQMSGGRRTVPQIFIGSTHVGGCDDLQALDRRGALVPLLNS